MNYLPHHLALSVRDLKTSLGLYRALGFAEVHRYTDERKTNVHLKLGNFYIEMFCFHQNKNKAKLNYEVGNNLTDLGVKHLALSVDDVEAALTELQTNGLAHEATTLGTKDKATFFFIQDPDGMWIEIIKDDRY